MDKLYRITIIGIKKIAIYRDYLFISVLKNGLYLYIQYMLWGQILLYQNKSNELPNLMLYFIINQFISIFYPKTSMELSDEIKEGSIINRLCKPISLEKQYFFEGIGSSITKICTISILNVILIVYFTKEVDVIKLVSMLLLILLGYLLNFVLELFFGSLAFFTQSIWGIDSFKTAMIAVFSGSFFPIFLYPEFLKDILNVLPFAYTSGKIAEYYVLGINFQNIVLLQVFHIVVIYVCYKQLITIGINRLTINGG